ncbi:unnamed protein product [Pedinophyceae sp. YPF-701]|nr:unnamed protein product [Pedinophyceae sp. YPF-701]
MAANALKPHSDPKEAPSDGSTPRGRTGDAGGPADGRSEPGGTGGDGGDRPMEQLRAEWARDAFPMFFNRWVCDAWFGALRHACSESGPNPRLHDKFEEIEEKASERMVEVTERHFDSVRSPRDVTHLLFCALHLGTYHALTTTGVPQREALDVLDGLSGGAGERATTFASQFSTWMASWLSDSYTHVSRQLARMATDYGEGMGCEIESSDAAPGRGESTTLRVGSCFYRRVFSEWDAELLLQFVCCRRDSSYYQGLERFGVGFERTSGGVGAGSCCMRVFRKAGAPPDRGEGE